MQRAGEPVVIFHAATTQQANLLRNMLEERGLAAWVQNDMIQVAAGALPLGWRGDAQVAVRDADAVEARKIVLEFEQRLREHADNPSALETDPSETVDAEAAPERWLNWPKCPECGERRHTKCGICGRAGTHFRMVDREETDEGEQVLLFCDDCDEPFEPIFYRLCHRCGHDFGEGIRVAAPSGPPARPGEWRKTWLAVAGVAAVILAIGVYFYGLFAR